MMNVKVFGCGAAGNKAAIDLIEAGFDREDVVLINTTDRDIPEGYRKEALLVGHARKGYLGGCGKERTPAKQMIMLDLNQRNIDLDSKVDENTNLAIIVSSTEGGSGSGMTPLIAKYIKHVLGIPVICVLFFGFNTDARGMQNSIEICQELENSYAVIGISNSKFLDDANSNRIKAEKLANQEFCNIMRIITGSNIKPGSQNIDRTDLYKLVATSGYMCVGSANIKGIKNVSMFESIVAEAIESSKLIDPSDKSVKRVGMIFDIPASMEDNISIISQAITDAYGTPYEIFSHIQNSSNNTATVSWIASGINMPIDAIRQIADEYNNASRSVVMTRDSFFDEIREFGAPSDGKLFNMFADVINQEPVSSVVGNEAMRNVFFKSILDIDTK